MTNKKLQFFKPDYTFDEQLLAMVENRYWTVLNRHVLADVLGKAPYCHMKKLVDASNVLKNSLQTYGPTSKKLPDLRPNKGTEGRVFHGHVHDGHKTTFVMEWGVIDVKKRQIALLGFAKHENYVYRQKPVSSDELTRILARRENKKIIEHVDKKIKEAHKKFARKHPEEELDQRYAH